MAYAALGVAYSNLGETRLAAKNTRKAYELRDRVSVREKLVIESRYNDLVTGDLEKALQAYLLWGQTYPRDAAPPKNLASIYGNLGQYDNALALSREALRLDPVSGQNYANLVDSYLSLNRLDEARATSEEAQKKNLDSMDLRWRLYFLGFASKDAAYMAQQAAWLAGNPGGQASADVLEADTAAYSGRLEKARELSRRAVAEILHLQLKETAAGVEVEAALREALFGNVTEARQHAGAALRLSTGRDVQFAAAFALAFAGDAAQAQTLAKDLGKRFPEDTIVQFNYLPTLDAQVTLNPRDASRSVEALRKASPFELGRPPFAPFSTALYPVYVRGSAFLALHRGNEATVEFQKILDHSGVVLSEPIGALAHLRLGRAYAMQGDTAEAKAAYQGFLTLWKDADPDIPILKQAKAEYAKLQ
jgi:tetratricopeptide (TPR) repeat protein